MSRLREVDAHYRRDGIAERILAQWREAAPDLRAAGPDVLPPLDEMHVRSRVATAELAAMTPLSGATRVLDIGSGLGGAARYLAATCGCTVLGVDLTAALCAAAARLSEAIGLTERTRFVRGSATALPVRTATFDVVWTQHAQMNIADKAAFYGQAAAALAPGGVLLFHDIFAVGNGLHDAAGGHRDGLGFPVPWAGDASISFLCTSEEAHRHLLAAGLRPVAWEDRTEPSLQWADGVLGRGPTRGAALVMGDTVSQKLANLRNGLERGILQVIMARYDRAPGAR